MIQDNEQDELIFDFLEGNLTTDEEHAFRMLKDESELLNRQVRLWQNTYLREPLPSVEALEKKMLITPVVGSGLSSRLRTTIVVILASVITSGSWFHQQVPALVAQGKYNHAGEPIHGVSVDATPPNSDTASNCLNEGRSHYIFTPVVRPKPEFVENHASPPIFTIHDLAHNPELAPLPMPSLSHIRIVSTVSEKSNKPLTARKWSGKEVRLLRKKLRDDERARKANEFLKGKEPYVVPLNSNNY